jgi:hypothetical protein
LEESTTIDGHDIPSQQTNPVRDTTGRGFGSLRAVNDDAQFRQRHLKSVCRKPIHSGWIGAQQGNVVAEIPAWPLIEMASANGPVHGRKTRSAARLKLGDFSCFRYA